MTTPNPDAPSTSSTTDPTPPAASSASSSIDPAPAPPVTEPPGTASAPVPAPPPRPSGPAETMDWKAKARHEEGLRQRAEKEAGELRTKLEEAQAGSAELAKLQAQLAEKDREILQQQAAAQAGVPQLAGRLKGETLEEMIADARSLVGVAANPIAGQAQLPVSGKAESDRVREISDRVRNIY